MQTINPWLPRFAKVLVVATFGLIFLGGMVTSMGAGLSVPDWPTSYGYHMFTFPMAKWVGGIWFEHTHRLLGSLVGLLTAVLVSWVWNNWKAPVIAALASGLATGVVRAVSPHIPALAGPEHEMTRKLVAMHVNIWSFAAALVIALLAMAGGRRRNGEPWVQWLSFGAFLLVCVQGTLGGLRVTETSIVLAMIHACTAQAFLCMTVAIAAGLSARRPVGEVPGSGIAGVHGLAWALTGAIYCQLIIGAVMRHLHAGLSIPTFPDAFGRLIPPFIDERVTIHFAHRVGAVVVTVLTIAVTVAVFRGARHKLLTRSVMGLLGTVALQVVLGALVILWARQPVVTSLHVVNGAVVLTKALMLAIRAGRLRHEAAGDAATLGFAGYREAHA